MHSGSLLEKSTHIDENPEEPFISKTNKHTRTVCGYSLFKFCLTTAITNMIPAEMKFYKDDFCKSKKKKKKENPAFDKERQKIIKETNILSCMQKKKFDKELHENQKNEKVGITVIR